MDSTPEVPGAQVARPDRAAVREVARRDLLRAVRADQVGRGTADRMPGRPAETPGPRASVVGRGSGQEVVWVDRREALEVDRREVLEVDRREALEVDRREVLEVDRREVLEVDRREVLEVDRREALEVDRAPGRVAATPAMRARRQARAVGRLWTAAPMDRLREPPARLRRRPFGAGHSRDQQR